MDKAEILASLQIMDLAKEWPRFRAIHDLVEQDLVTANEEAQAEIAKRAEEKAKAAAAGVAKAAAKAKADAERDAALAQRQVPPAPRAVPAASVDRRTE